MRLFILYIYLMYPIYIFCVEKVSEDVADDGYVYKRNWLLSPASKNMCRIGARRQILNFEVVRYISVEHPVVEYYNPKYGRYFNMTARRYSRRNPVYYVEIHFYTKKILDNNIMVDFYIYELLTNVYKRSFVEMHNKLCDFLHKDKFFGAPVRQGKLAKPCPYLPGAYDLYNMTVPPASIPKSFPFRKGRIYCNVTNITTKETLLNIHIDMEIKEVKMNNDNITFSGIN